MFDFELARQILEMDFGYPEFRGLQEPVIRAISSGHHVLAIMPTGMGKSLCFQIPALAVARQAVPRELPPLTLVLSPLVALMKDQVDTLVARGIDATFVNSSLTRADRSERYQRLSAGGYDLLYVTPERFRKNDFLETVARRKVELLAVDEAHCISEWGHDFRPDYTRIAEIRELMGNPLTIALTATATPDVQQDIVRQLGLEPSQVKCFHQGIDRPNLSLSVRQVWDDDTKLEQIAEMRQRQAGSGIVYFTLIRTLMQFSDELKSRGIGHLIYHGELPRERRRQLQERFMDESGHVVLATNAFGMGIDKEDIRFVMHADLPGSLESYYQEIGRAGRDGRPSECLLLYDERDLATQMEFLRWSNPDALFYRRVYDLLAHDLERINAFGLEWLREKLHHKRKHDRRLETAMSMLKRWNVIAGTLDPLRIELQEELPGHLADPSHADAKLKRDQQKLLAIVQYARYEGDRKEFLNRYFGV